MNVNGGKRAVCVEVLANHAHAADGGDLGADWVDIVLMGAALSSYSRERGHRVVGAQEARRSFGRVRKVIRTM